MASHCYSLHFLDNLSNWSSFRMYTPFIISLSEIHTLKCPMGHLFNNKFEILAKPNYKWYTLVDFNISHSFNREKHTLDHTLCFSTHTKSTLLSKRLLSNGLSLCPPAEIGGCHSPALCCSGCSRERENPSHKLRALYLLWGVEMGTGILRGKEAPLAYSVPIQSLFQLLLFPTLQN